MSGQAVAAQQGAIPLQFLRKAWVSIEARLFHQERLKRILAAWEAAEFWSADRVRPCALVSVLSSDHADWIARVETARLATLPLRTLNITPHGSAEPVFTTEMVIGSRGNAKRFRTAWIKGDSSAMGGLLGYPSCCRAFFQSALGSGKTTDPVWLMGLATPGASTTRAAVSLSGLREANVLLRRIGVRAVPHFPCSFACEPSRRFSHELTNLASARGYGVEIGWLYEMLDWPIRWSALHGIAEIRTPVLKIATHTDATSEAHTLDWLGETLPAEAAQGLDFPYRQHA
jgi:hypothetical protein